MSAHTYSRDFYDYIDTGSRASAQVVASLLSGEMSLGSLLDVGGGHGAWAREWRDAGIADVVAVDGAYVDQRQLVIPASCFVSHDLKQPLALGRKFDLVQSLEVAEHIEEQSADTFIDSLVRHGDVILFSAAVPGQGGEHHVNEQPPEYWRRKFASRGFCAFDWLRPHLAEHKAVKPWYRYNTLIYSNAQGLTRLSEAIRNAKVDEGVHVSVGGNLSWAFRRAAVSFMPSSLIKPVAMAKASIEARLKRNTPWD